MRIRFAFGLICLFLLFALRPAANAQTVNGNNDAAFAVGGWPTLLHCCWGTRTVG